MRKSLQSPLPLAALLIALILPVASLTTAPPANAMSGSTEPVRVVVSHGDLDLTNAADLARLNQRLASSVKRACPILTRDLRELSHARRCRQTAAANATAKKDIAIAAAQANRQQHATARDPNAVAAQ